MGSKILLVLEIALQLPLELVAVTEIVYVPPLLNKKVGEALFNPVLLPLEGEIFQK